MFIIANTKSLSHIYTEHKWLSNLQNKSHTAGSGYGYLFVVARYFAVYRGQFSIKHKLKYSEDIVCHIYLNLL